MDFNTTDFSEFWASLPRRPLCEDLPLTTLPAPEARDLRVAPLGDDANLVCRDSVGLVDRGAVLREAGGVAPHITACENTSMINYDCYKEGGQTIKKRNQISSNMLTECTEG